MDELRKYIMDVEVSMEGQNDSEASRATANAKLGRLRSQLYGLFKQTPIDAIKFYSIITPLFEQLVDLCSQLADVRMSQLEK